MGVNSSKFKLNDANPANIVDKSDFLAFSLIVVLAKKSQAPGLKMPSLLEIIVKDATRYFLIIFTSHLVFELTLNLGRVSVTVQFSLACRN